MYKHCRKLAAILEDDVNDWNEDWDEWDDCNTDSDYEEEAPSSLPQARPDDMSLFSLCGLDGDDSIFSFINGDSSSSGMTPFMEVVDKRAMHKVATDGAAEDVGSFTVVANKDDADSLSCATLQTMSVDVCVICLEEKPLMQLMNKCRCHPSACFDCLRTHYVIKAPRHYPLRCFWPSCDRTLRDIQIKKLVTNEKELNRYYQNEAAAKAVRAAEKEKERAMINRKTRASHTRLMKQNERLMRENRLWKEFFSHFSREEAMSLIEALGANPLDGAVLCPSCQTVFSKDGGCDDMRCAICDHEFSFERAKISFD